jgi:CPA2 family monovalent cation:H+ antiporter-2
VIGKSLAAFLIVRAFRHPTSTALTISASLAQIGEFSFILASLGVSLALLPKTGSDLILAGAILSILINPLLFAALDRYLARPKPGAAPGVHAETPSREPIPVTALTGHVVLVGHGRVGGFVTPVIAGKVPLLVIEDSNDVTEKLKERGIEAIAGNAADPEVIAAANLSKARWLLVAVPDAFEGGQVVEQARRISPSLRILARSHSEEETAHLLRHGATQVIMGEHEIAKAMIADIEAELSVSTAHSAAPPATASTDGATAESPPPSGTGRSPVDP